MIISADDPFSFFVLLISAVPKTQIAFGFEVQIHLFVVMFWLVLIKKYWLGQLISTQSVAKFISLEWWWECQKMVLMVVLSGNFIWFGRAHWTRWVRAPQSGSERPCAWWCWTLPAVSATLGRTQWPYFEQTCGSAHHAQSPWRTEGKMDLVLQQTLLNHLIAVNTRDEQNQHKWQTWS